MDALIYGFRPKAIIEKFASVPPEKTSKRERRGLPRNNCDRVALSIPATGICAASLKITKIPAVTRSFLRIEGVFMLFSKNWAICLNIN
jgi:hypothetical protein